MKKNLTNSNESYWTVYGINPIEALLQKAPDSILEIYIIDKPPNKRLKKILELLNSLVINFNFLDKLNLDKISRNNKHQGIVVRIKPLKFKNQNDLKRDITTSDFNQLFLILDSIQDPSNLGSCIRTAAAAGVKGIIINQNGSAKINEYVFKSSAGAIFNLNLYFVPNLTQSIKLLKENGFWIFGLSSESKNTIYDEKFIGKTGIVLGSEGTGIRKLIIDNCDNMLKIPMNKNTESLNLSVAAGIALYEINRQLDKEIKK